MWVVGLKENQTVGNHLTFIGRPILSIENRPEIPGYTFSVSENDTELIRAVRSDPSVGFVTKVSQNYFHKHEKYVSVHRDQMRFNPAVWKRLFLVGLPVGLEFVLIAIVLVVLGILVASGGLFRRGTRRR